MLSVDIFITFQLSSKLMDYRKPFREKLSSECSSQGSPWGKFIPRTVHVLGKDPKDVIYCLEGAGWQETP